MDKKQLLRLRGEAHKLKPVVIIGSNGLTAAVHQEIELALESHELIKVRVNAKDRTARKTMINQICEEHKAEEINQIGHIVAIFRRAERK
jgi:RNA-binding protein